jgi:hypothetical protein
MEELHKAHRAPKAGAKATKKSDKKGKVTGWMALGVSMNL